MKNIVMTKAELEAMDDRTLAAWVLKYRHHCGGGIRLAKNQQTFQGHKINYPTKVNLDWDYKFDQAFNYERAIKDDNGTQGTVSIMVIETRGGFRVAYNRGGYFREARVGFNTSIEDHQEDWILEFEDEHIDLLAFGMPEDMKG